MGRRPVNGAVLGEKHGGGIIIACLSAKSGWAIFYHISNYPAEHGGQTFLLSGGRAGQAGGRAGHGPSRRNQGRRLQTGANRIAQTSRPLGRHLKGQAGRTWNLGFNMEFDATLIPVAASHKRSYWENILRLLGVQTRCLGLAAGIAGGPVYSHFIRHRAARDY